MTKTRQLVRMHRICSDHAYQNTEESLAATLAYLRSLIEVFEQEYKSAESILDKEIEKAAATLADIPYAASDKC